MESILSVRQLPFSYHIPNRQEIINIEIVVILIFESHIYSYWHILMRFHSPHLGSTPVLRIYELFSEFGSFVLNLAWYLLNISELISSVICLSSNRSNLV